ncbi:hypothetical protein SEA_REINDEER_120 [Mycobacterium phage Reindeer]|uniref:Uncharacterized protein n=1 Tax=Mycobacterium phage Reindeer TaxID=2762283 RepID=A0A7G8LI39_9CAUD|nr:hypothetical protein J4U05_gp132 [Mycobacterium phage Reindeer]QNJ56911.1 hypothetical protein SEA_REINDEER_120 [Mycobacterium phage Reindeer]
MGDRRCHSKGLSLMILKVKVLGFEVLTVELESDEGPGVQLTAVDKGVKGMSHWWFRRMNR